MIIFRRKAGLFPLIIVISFIFVIGYYVASHTKVIVNAPLSPETDITADALGLIQSFLSLFVIVIAFFTVFLGTLVWWIQQRFTELDRIQNILDAQYDLAMSMINMTLDQIPSMTYTQQLPFSFYRQSEAIIKFFNNFDEDSFWTNEIEVKKQATFILCSRIIRIFGSTGKTSDRSQRSTETLNSPDQKICRRKAH